MSRKVDIKALVSHVVRGDGINRCRICMGETTDGQVFLGDTVMLDGDQPVTLSELLETITGVEVPMSDDLPDGLCTNCSVSALNAADFRTICRQAAHKWDAMLQLLDTLPKDLHRRKTLFAVIGDSDKMILIDDRESFPNASSAAERITRQLKPEDERGAVLETSRHRCQCPNCGKRFPYTHGLYQHLKESTDHQRACYVCARIMSRDELVTHLSAAHNRSPYDCKRCPALLRTPEQFVQHQKAAHSPGTSTCGDCGRSFRTPNAFRAHLSVHTAKTCPGCDVIFRNQTCYFYHVKKCCNLENNRGDGRDSRKGATVEVRNIKSDKRIRVGMRGRTDRECICDYCDKKFAGKKFVSAHIQIVHMRNTHRPCVYCGKSVAAAHMSEHVKKHEVVRAYKCDLCGIVLKTKLGYIQHLRLHSGERPYACGHCGETFSASSRRSEHVRKIHMSSEIVLKHACEKCPARFRLPYRLKKHNASVHNIKKEESQFECGECREKFSSCRGLLHHSRTHQLLSLKKKTNKDMQCRVYSEPLKIGSAIDDT